jgi:hypothetical protein
MTALSREPCTVRASSRPTNASSRTGFAFESLQQDLAQHGPGPEIGFPVETDHCRVLIMVVSRQQAHRPRTGRAPRGVGLNVSGEREI